MLFDDNDYYDHIFGSNDINNDFNFDFNDFINNEPSNVNSPQPNDTSDVMDLNPPNPLPPLSNTNSIAYYFEDYTQLKEYGYSPITATNSMLYSKSRQLFVYAFN